MCSPLSDVTTVGPCCPKCTGPLDVWKEVSAVHIEHRNGKFIGGAVP